MQHQRPLKSTLKIMLMFMIFMASLLGSVRVSTASSPKDIVLEVAQNSLLIYDKPSLGSKLLQTLVTGQRLLWNGVTQMGDARNWMQVMYGALSGWATPGNTVLYPVDVNQITPGVEISVLVQVQINSLPLYQSTSFSSPIAAQVPNGTTLKVMDGPILSELYTWWKVQTNGATLAQGWIADDRSQVKIVKPLQVYGYTFCDNFNLRIFGVLGWDSIASSLKTLIPTKEKIVCLASANLKGDKSPVVVVLSRITLQPNSTFAVQDTLRIFDQSQAGVWSNIYEQAGDQYAVTEQLRLHDLAGDGIPALLWLVRNQGTGEILKVTMLRYSSVSNPAGMQPILTSDLYKGLVQVADNHVVLLQAYLRSGEANCCATGLQRTGYTWQDNQFSKTVNNEILQAPEFLQGLPK